MYLRVYSSYSLYKQGTLLPYNSCILLILAHEPFNFLTSIVDRDQTVSRRSKPSSRTFLNVEQTYPWILLLIQDKMSRHRGAKLPRQLGLLRAISLLSLA